MRCTSVFVTPAENGGGGNGNGGGGGNGGGDDTNQKLLIGAAALGLGALALVSSRGSDEDGG